MIWFNSGKLGVWHNLKSGFVLLVHGLSDVVWDEEVMYQPLIW